ncbi:alpha/beta hydrolase [Desulfonema ishimotonii]|uniref:Alpha/beta hydrolase n=1 Tax=Desulfonema ishimotonii TaxID=45657 RepID=A0A401G345_9BACT|nr:alpha/beta fold hydrolase [Desulfonema ishimotonii]GBC63644.1 alpha/beta hydrolase [Desulfonema ishimotonii]
MRQSGSKSGIPRLFQQIPVLILLILLTGCAHDVGVRQVALAERFEDMDRSALNSDSPSERTLLFLRQRDLIGAWTDGPVETLERIDRMLDRLPDRDTLFALTELCYIRANREPDLSAAASKYFLSCALYASTYLFDDNFGPPPSAFHPHSRQACEFYNRSLAEGLRYVRDRSGLRKAYPVIRGEVRVEEHYSELVWQLREFEAFHMAYEYEVKGLENHHQAYGIGLPLIAVRTPPADGTGRKEERFMPQIRQSYAATVVLRFRDSLHDRGDVPFVYRARAELYDPLKTREIRFGERTAPLETDLTTPLAYMMESTPPARGITGLLDTNSWRQQQGLHMLQPYERDKIPVVFIHGLMSSPITWLPMFNNLMGDPVLRERCQFWFFMYPTGNPILYSASILRESLKQIRHTFDPDGHDPAFSRMVLVGHSMGGLLSRLMVSESGDRFWRYISEKPPEDFDLTEDQRILVNRVFFFKPLPFISRVIFISAPHRGSAWADRRIGRIGASLVRLPFTLIKNSVGLLASMGQTPLQQSVTKMGKIPTGIDGLSPNSYFMQATAGLRISPEIPCHSIIGNRDAADTPGGTDGIVPYASSHLDDAVSEIIVRSGHSAQKHPLAILEVRRILADHLNTPVNEPFITSERSHHEPE